VRMRLCIFLTLLIITCSLSCHGSGGDQSIVGAWEVVHMSIDPVSVDNLPSSGLAGGRMEFKEDGTLEGAVSMPGVPQGMRISGTYRVDGDVITINNDTNKSTTQSRMRFEKDYLVLEPITREPLAYAMYYRRIK
jgi:hypothetical protein